ncbi:MAG: porin family protein [Alphaproteobacteria bacterium]|nr:porin family protein [Alphaproteobacteria bacterium]
MKKTNFILCSLITAFCVQGAYANPFEYDYYAGARFGFTMADFKETQNLGVLHLPANIDADFTVKHSASMMGGNMFMGYRLNRTWSLEGELGFLGSYSDEYEDFELSINTPYVQANLLANTARKKSGWFYAGAGLGVALPTISVTDKLNNPASYLVGEKNSTSMSPLVAFMAGYKVKPAPRWFVDFGYKLSMYQGGSLSRLFADAENDPIEYVHMFNTVGLVTNHTLQLGIGYEF